MGYARFYGANNDAAAGCEEEGSAHHRSADHAGKSRILDELVELTALALRLCQGGVAERVNVEDCEA